MDRTGDPARASDQALPRVLEAFGLDTAGRVQPAGGTASPKWAVDSSCGRFIVRVRPDEFSGDDSIRFDHTALRQLRAAGLPVPEPRPRPDGSTWLSLGGRVYEVLSWIEGEPFDERDHAAVRDLGTFLAKFHRVLDEYIPGKDGELREDHGRMLAPYFQRIQTLAADEDHGQLERVGQQLDIVRRELDDELYASLPHRVIHGDVHPGNVRFRNSRVAAVYDFDYMTVQARARDISDGLILFGSARETPMVPDDIRSLTQSFRPDPVRCRLLLDGYRSISPLTEAEWTALPLMMRSRWIQMRLRGTRKFPEPEKVAYVLYRFFEVIDWLDHESPGFFTALRSDRRTV